LRSCRGQIRSPPVASAVQYSNYIASYPASPEHKHKLDFEHAASDQNERRRKTGGGAAPSTAAQEGGAASTAGGIRETTEIEFLQ